MALVNGEWLDRPAREARIELLAQRVVKLEQLRKQGAARDSHVDLLIADKKELIRLNRVHRAERDVLFFTYEYFSDDRNPDKAGPLAY